MQRITLCLWAEGKYEDTPYEGADRTIESTVIEGFDLSAAQIIAFGQPKAD